MGLGLSVGMLADLLENDEEGADWFREDIAKLSAVLVKAGLEPHNEPEETDIYSAATYGYSGLHHLRRCAAHLHYAGKPPPPLVKDENATTDAHYQRYSAEFEQENANVGVGKFAVPSKRPFDHLINHSDAEGFYIPQRFDRVLIAGDQAYGWVGSSFALAQECERIADALSLPSELLNAGEDNAFIDAIQAAQGVKPSGWSMFKPKAAAVPAWRELPIAAMLCAKLYCAANHSIRTGAALVFC